MVVYKLYDIPNFAMTASPEGNDYNFTFRYFQGLTYVTIRDSDANVIAGPIRVANGQWLILSQSRNYQGAGNFVIVDDKGHYPIYKNFSRRCELRYYTAEELREMYG